MFRKWAPMALRDKLADRVTPLLESGEQPQQVFLAQGGLNPWLAGLLGVLGRALVKPRLIAVTDRGVVVFEASFTGTKPASLLARLPRATRLGPVGGLWAPITVAGEKLYVHKRFHKDVNTADGVAA
jgi:hypothetical protein